MNRLFAIGCVAALTLGVSGCGGNSAEANVKEQIGLFNDLADAAQKKDAARMQEISQKLKDLQEKLKQFSADEQKAAMEKHAQEYLAAAMKAGMAAAGDQLGKMMQGMGDMMKGGPAMPTLPGATNKPPEN